MYNKFEFVVMAKLRIGSGLLISIWPFLVAVGRFVGCSLCWLVVLLVGRLLALVLGIFPVIL